MVMTRTHASAHTDEHLQAVAAELATNGSVELSLRPDRVLGEAAELLPRGTSVYVPWPEKRPFGSNLERIRNLSEAGFEAVPHIVARAVPSRQDLLDELLHIAGSHNVHRVMLIGGDRQEAIGPYACAADVLDDGVLGESGIKEVGVAGYPEGHPVIPPDTLMADLELKRDLAAKQGLGIEIITQFSFVPSRVIEYCSSLARTLPEIPVYIGMAGPAPIESLRRYARYCGVSASLRALMRLGVPAAESATHTEPDEQMMALAHFCAAREACNVIGVHVYSFGGFLETARWMRRQCRPA